jgi:hypothetical protein
MLDHDTYEPTRHDFRRASLARYCPNIDGWHCDRYFQQIKYAGYALPTFEEGVIHVGESPTDEVFQTRNRHRITFFPFPIGARSVVCVAEANAMEYWRALKGAIPSKLIPLERHLEIAHGKTTAAERRNS